MSAKISQLVIAWQPQHGRRDLPWQKRQTAYRVWVSEIMLQQTQVATVSEYYRRFMLRFPTVKKLANSDEDEVLALWSGLGYYARARHLHQAAKIIAQNGLPKTVEQWRALPGIGASTAAAIMVFSAGEKHAILDGNVKRVMARLFMVQQPLNSTAANAILWQKSQQCLPADNIKTYTQGLMDLGAMVCLRTKPNCPACPLRRYCQAYKNGKTADFPIRAKKITQKHKKIYMVQLCYKNQVLIYKRANSGIWAGLWSLPEADTKKMLLAQWQAIMATNTLSAPLKIKHELTHYKLEIQIFTVKVSNLIKVDGYRWLPRQQHQKYGMPKPITRLLSAPCPHK